MARGISRRGSLASSTTLARSSNPMKAKKASRLPNPMPDSAATSSRRSIHQRGNDRDVSMNGDKNNRYQSSGLNQRKYARDDYQFQNSPSSHGAEPDDQNYDNEGSREIDKLLNISG